MKRLILLFVSMLFLFSCELTINKEITSQYLIDGITNGNLDIYLQGTQIFRYKGKPGFETVAIGNPDLSKYENCFVLHVATGTTMATTVSSAIIKLDGLEVLNTSDFSKNGGTYSFEVCDITQTSSITVEIRGEPGSYLEIWIEGKLSNRGTFTDSRDGKVYKWVKIGNQTWMAENLAYLPSVGRPAYMEGSSTEPRYYVWVYEGNSEGNTSVVDAKQSPYYGIYGVLYNAPAALGGNLSSNTNPSGIQGACPDGWHVPSGAEWNQLGYTIDAEQNLGNYLDEGDPIWWVGISRYLKATTQWCNVCAYPPGNPPCDPPNYDPYGGIIEGNDYYGFSAYPSGILFMNEQLWGGWDGGTLYRADYWSTSSTNPLVNTVWQLTFQESTMTHYSESMLKSFGVSIRCVKDN